MRVLSLVPLLTLLLNACKTDSFSVMSKKMEVSRSVKNSAWKGRTFHDIRMQVFKNGHFNALIRDIDTLHALQSYDIQSGAFYCINKDKFYFIRYGQISGYFISR
ncbi:hypothetical protein CLV42_10879 [Chitinophaga ginsengisoli]|uniref:Uncharacterized protein n=1 Tax=Chitinophaga ginsengisoli TaxID=363837 RepID=A0A2P8G2F3_9BACT|nr:hypothetical protein CLV42_10879 [Chitinophaga ginsengisoli]